MLKNYITMLCKLLDISIPNISHNTKHFNSNTMLAQCNPPKNTIYFKKQNNINPDLMFSIAHEIRHLWQFNTDFDSYFSTYKSVDVLGVEKYNMQITEIDANAFASIVMRVFFGLRPQFRCLSDKVISQIHERECAIEDEILF